MSSMDVYPILVGSPSQSYYRLKWGLRRKLHESMISMFCLFYLPSRRATVKRVVCRFPHATRIGGIGFPSYMHLHLSRTPTAPVQPRPIGRTSGSPSRAIRMAHEVDLGPGDLGDIYPPHGPTNMGNTRTQIRWQEWERQDLQSKLQAVALEATINRCTSTLSVTYHLQGPTTT